MSVDAQKPDPIPVDVRLRDADFSSISSEVRTEIFRWMVESRPEKFEKFLTWLKRFRYGVCSCVRGDLMEYYYCALRFSDDVGDGHHPLPDGFSSRPDYVNAKLAFARNPQHPKDAIDQILLHCYQMAERLGFSLQTETEHMLQSILFDAERRGMHRIFPCEVLDQNFSRLDIDGTVSATLKIFGEDPQHCSALEPLGTATRKYYSLRDFRDDVDGDGLINIPQEHMREYGIQCDDLRNPDSMAVKNWSQQEALEAMDLIQTHVATIDAVKLKRVTKFTLDRVYVRPAKKFLEEMLSRFA